MRAIKNTKKHNKLLIGPLAVAFLVAGLAAVGYTQKLGPFSEADTEGTQSVDLNEPTNEQVTAGQDIKLNSVKSSDVKVESNNNSSGNVNSEDTKKNVAVTITNKNNSEPSSVSIKTLIQEVSSSGTCTLTLSKTGEKTVTKSASVQPLPNGSTCKGFSFSGLASGTWGIQLIYSSKTAEGSATETVVIK